MSRPGPRTRILLIDDHPAMRHGLAQLIDAEPDLEVCGEAEDRASLLDRLVDTTPDLIVLDIALRDRTCSGLDLVPDIRSRLGEVPILIYSMHDEAFYAERALRAGARGYLMKQEPVRQVIVALRLILEGGVYLSPEINRSLLMRHVGPAAATGRPDPATSLTGRQFEVLRLIGRGLQPREIAGAMNLSVKTVETHRRNIRRRLNLADAAALTRFAVDYVHGRT